MYGLAVQAGFYGNVVECLILDLAAGVQFPAGPYVISIFSPVDLTPNVNNTLAAHPCQIYRLVEAQTEIQGQIKNGGEYVVELHFIRRGIGDKHFFTC